MAEGTAVKKKQNHFLRILSAVLIMFVVIVHYKPVIWVGDYNIVDVIQSIGRFAMPVFFMISGYFLYSSDGHSERRIGDKAKHIFILIVFMKFFYLALDLVMCALGYVDSKDVLWNFFVIGDTTAHYWFVATLLTIYLGHWIFYKMKWDFKYLIPLGVLLLAIDMIIGEALPLFGIDTVFGMSVGDVAAGTYVTIGLFFFQVGYYLHKHHDWVETNLRTCHLVWLMIFGMLLTVVEIFYILNTHIFDGTASSGPNVYVGTIIFSIPMFILTFRIGENTFRWRSMEWLGTYVSSYMYVFIGFGICILQEIILADYKDDLFIYQILGPALAIVIDIAMALLMYVILKKISSSKKKKLALAQQ